MMGSDPGLDAAGSLGANGAILMLGVSGLASATLGSAGAATVGLEGAMIRERGAMIALARAITESDESGASGPTINVRARLSAGLLGATGGLMAGAPGAAFGGSSCCPTVVTGAAELAVLAR